LKDYFYNHIDSVWLGFLGSVAAILLLLILALWICSKVW
jgi:hypothetical protein